MAIRLLSCSLASLVMPDNNAMSPPPPYDSGIDPDDPGAKFRHTFAGLARNHQDIMSLFKDVALQLAIAPELGPHHPLTEEWDSIRQVGLLLIW